MRRNEFEITAPEELADFLAEQRWGQLSINGDDGYPYTVPLNYLFDDDRIYFHSAPAGRKIDLLAKDPRVQFTVVREYSYIPSYFPGSETACSASQFFKSAIIRGQAVAVEALPQKIMIFRKLMEVYQPEGKYRPLTEESEAYRRMAGGTGLYMICPENISLKFKFGQNLTEDVYRRIIQFLSVRNTPPDAETVAMMQRYRGTHSK